MVDKLEREILVDVAMGYEPADVVITNGQIVNVHTGLIQSDGIAIKGSRIAALGDVKYAVGPKTKVIDAGRQFLVPGLVDPHAHVWHTYTNSTVVAACRLLHGSTSMTCGFYGHAIVNGMKAVRFFLDELLATPVKPIFLVPTCCYGQNRRLGFPPSPNAPSIDDLLAALDWPEARGVEETGYELILEREFRDRGLIRLIEKALGQGKVVSAHAAQIPDDRSLNGIVAVGMSDNHEIVSLKEAMRQAEVGMYVLIREGAACNDIREVLPLITQRGYASRACQLCADAVTANWAFEPGQMDNALRVAIRNGLDPIRAIQMSTIQPAEHFRVNHDVGVIAPGRIADIVFVEHLVDFKITKVMANGAIWVEGGKLVKQLKQPRYPKWLYETMNIKRVLKAEDFKVAAPPGSGPTVRVRVINMREGSLETTESIETLPVANGTIQGDPGRGINKIAMIDRIFGTGEMGVAFIKAFSLREGCMGTTANVFNENIVLVGASDQDMAVAANEAIKMGGGFTAVRQGKLVAAFPTPLNGLVTDLSVEETRKALDSLMRAWQEMGCTLEAPHMTMEFATLVTIPSLHICTKGLAVIQGYQYELVNLVV